MTGDYVVTCEIEEWLRRVGFNPDEVAVRSDAAIIIDRDSRAVTVTHHVVLDDNGRTVVDPVTYEPHTVPRSVTVPDGIPMDPPESTSTRVIDVTGVLRYFDARHLPEPMRTVSEACGLLARLMVAQLPESDQRKIGLQHLMEAKDCFVRATLDVMRSGGAAGS